MNYKIGDRVRMTTRTYGEVVQDKRGKTIHQRPAIDTYVGVVEYVGPECPFPSCEVVRCNGGDVDLKSTHGFSFYPKDNGTNQVVEVLK